MRCLKFFLAIFFPALWVQLAVGAPSEKSLCAQRITVLISAMLTSEGFGPNPFKCDPFSTCQFQLRSGGDSTQNSNQIYYADYTFGGNYPNVNSYAITMNAACEVESLRVQRN